MLFRSIHGASRVDGNRQELPNSSLPDELASKTHDENGDNQQQAPLQVNTPDGPATKGPDGKWRDGYDHIITDPNDLARLERESETQRQNRQMAPGRQPMQTLPGRNQ